MPRDELKVAAERLRRCCNSEAIKFATTENIPDFDGVIGQERALQALEFGLDVEAPGYNIFVAGRPGTGRTSAARVLVGRRAVTRYLPPDWCYVYNFDAPDEPVVLSLPAGQGRAFTADMAELVDGMTAAVPQAFTSPDYEESRARIVQAARLQIQHLLAQARELAAAQGFNLTLAPGEGGGFNLGPAEAGTPDQPDRPVATADTAAAAEQRRPNTAARKPTPDATAATQAAVAGIMRQAWELDKAARDTLRQLDIRLAHFTVAPAIGALKEKYGASSRVAAWLTRVEREIVENIQAFIPEGPGTGRREYPLARFQVNDLVVNRGPGGAPVVVEHNPTWVNLFGKVEPGPGTSSDDLTVIKAGALHRANGGYLILPVEEILKHVPTWDALKRALSSRLIYIEPAPEPRPFLGGPVLKPEPMPLNVKVILIGRHATYQMLYQMDEGFRKNFKIKVEFDDRMDWSAHGQAAYVSLLATFARRERLLPLTGAAVARVLEHSSRLAADQRKLSTEFNELFEIVYEADTLAKGKQAVAISSDHVQRAIRDKRMRSALQEERMHELIARGQLLFATEGTQAGQVNGLTVMNVGDHAFGLPSRVTCQTYMGRRGVIQIERETEMSGKIHAKGVLALSAYLGGTYAKDIPISINASLSFEQLYAGVEGDSASSTELYALLSSLADLPIDQGIAVTGSVDQYGVIQPVGGVMYKIEGWYQTCRRRGLTGRQGVMIPYQNVVNLQLDEEIVTAVQEGQFHIWAISTIDEGIAILTGMAAGERDADGRFPAGTVHDRVYRRLAQFADGLRTFEG